MTNQVLREEDNRIGSVLHAVDYLLFWLHWKKKQNKKKNGETKFFSYFCFLLYLCPLGKERHAGFTKLLEFIKEKEVNVLAKSFKFQLFLVIITEMLDDGGIRWSFFKLKRVW